MNRREKRNLFIKSTLAVNIFIIMFYAIFGFDSSIGYALVQGIMSIIIIYLCLKHVYVEYEAGCLSIARITLLVVSLYYYMGCIKYSIDNLYKDFDLTQNDRLIGSVYVFIAIILADRIVAIIYKKNAYNYLKKLNSELVVDSGMSNVWIFIYMVYSISNIILNPMTMNYGEQHQFGEIYQYLMVLDDMLLYAAILISSYTYKKGKKWQLYIVIGIASYISFVKGSRSTLMTVALAILFGMLIFNNFKIRQFINIVLLVPYFFIAYSSVSLLTSGRLYRDMNVSLKMNLAYRCDFADFPMALLKGKKYLFMNLGVIADGIKMALPGALFGGKDNLDTAKDLYIQCGLNPKVDYTDSFFSMGTEAFGVVGLLMFLAVIVGIYALIDRRFQINGTKSIASRIAVFSMFTNVECHWLIIFANIRNVVLVIIGIKLIFILASRIRIRSNKNYENNVRRWDERH